MVFLSTPKLDYWCSELPVKPLIKALLGKKADLEKRVLFTESRGDALEFVLAQAAVK
jgi:hypothetical protein